MTTLTITLPDDWHVHLRDGNILHTTVPHVAERFGRAIVMPNLKPPVATVADAMAYRERINAVIPKGSAWQPLMTLYLTDQTTPAIIKSAKESGSIIGCKLYPAGATTHSAAGVTKLDHIAATFAAMEEVGLPLLVHAETTDPSVDIFDREAVFLDQYLTPLLQQFPKLRLVVEHLSTAKGVAWVHAAPKNVAATITVHHLLYTRNDLLVGGIRPHLYCLPILKSRNDREALLKAAISGSPKFFLGTDSAPHAQSHKETACGCAGIYTAHAGIELYAEIFSQAGALDKLEAFASFHGADFYQLPRNTAKITLIDEPWIVPESFSFGEEKLIPLRAGEKVLWKIHNQK